MDNKEVSVCIIAKDEERNIGGCLESVKEAANEIIVVDTGSTDDTKSIAEKFDCKIYDFEWRDDFSAARNFAAEKANGEFILSIDADERLVNPETVSDTIKNAKSKEGGWLVEVLSKSNRKAGDGDFYIHKLLRLYRNQEGIKYRGRIHEQIIHSIEDSGLKISDSPIKIEHLGYSVSADAMKKKLNRNLKLLNREIEENPENGYLYFHRAKTYLSLENIEAAEKDLEAALEYSPKEGSTYPQALNSAALAAYKAGDFKKAIDKANESLEVLPNQTFANLIMGDSYAAQENFAEAYEAYNRIEEAIKTKDIKSLIAGEYGAPDEAVLFRMGRCLLNLKLYDEAIEDFKSGIRQNPEEPSNLIGVANCLFHKKRFGEAREFLNKAISLAPERKDLRGFLKQLDTVERAAKGETRVAESGKPKPFLSLSMIVKNEEKYLAGCLDSVKGVVDEMVIVDTGSEDKTKAIAEKYGARVYDYEWSDDFAAARNESLKRCEGEWVLYLDADERLKNANKLRGMLENASDKIGAFIVTIESEHLQLSDKTEVHRGGYPRIIRNYGYPAIYFKGRVHEQITPSVFALGKSIEFSDLVIEHLGYNRSREEMDRKVRRNYNMLIQHVREEPLNSYAWYQLGQTLAQLRLNKEAEKSIRMALKIGDMADSVYASATATLAHMTGSRKNFKETLRLAKASLSKAPEQIYALHLKAYALLYLNKPAEAEKDFIEVLKRLKRKKGVPKSGFDIDIDEETVKKGLREARVKLGKS